ncbi:transmembrane emp24 domain-containing protein 3-like [Diadema setosum]|uniref:transmembrane emp24 domain-containing protein 3-like n=1 Tax=Diadema setosum TaxID=31175 RepID=UPI003B3BD247
MSEIPSFFIVFVTILVLLAATHGVELTFELPDNANQCFYEDVEKDVKIILEYQVVTGGQYDVDAVLKSPSGAVVYKEKRKQYDTFTWTADQTGVVEFCFSNEFSTFAHKTVYFDFVAGDDDPLIRDIGAHATALTQLETSCVTIHEALKAVINFQTHYRLREAKGRSRAEGLNQRVQLWSLGEFILILIIGIGEVIVLRSFFSVSKPRAGRI